MWHFCFSFVACSISSFFKLNSNLVFHHKRIIAMGDGGSRSPQYMKHGVLSPPVFVNDTTSDSPQSWKKDHLFPSIFSVKSTACEPFTENVFMSNSEPTAARDHTSRRFRSALYSWYATHRSLIYSGSLTSTQAVVSIIQGFNPKTCCFITNCFSV